MSRIHGARVLATVCSAVFAAVLALPAQLDAQAAGQVTAPGRAQQTIPARLTLEDALRLAHAHNPTMLQTTNDVDVANAAVRSAYGQFMPSLSTSMNVSGSQSHVETYVDPITQRPAALETPETSSGSSLSQSVGMGITLFDGGRMFKNLAIQKANVRSSEAGIAIQMNMLDANVRQSFFLALRATQSIELSERLLASAQDRLKQTEALFRTAARSTVDVLGAKEDIATQEMSLEAARNDATKARLALAQVIGMSSDGSFELVDALPDVYDPARLSIDSLVSLARRVNPTLQRQELNAQVADKQASVASAARWPTLSASLGYGRGVSLPSYTAYRYLNPKNSSASLSFSFSLPVFSRFTTSAQITSAHASAEDARLQLEQARLQMETDVRTAYIDFTNAYHSLQLADLKSSISNERLSLSQEQYQRGTITFTDLQQIIDRAAASQRDALNARYAWISSLITLEQRVGAPIAN